MRKLGYALAVCAATLGMSTAAHANCDSGEIRINFHHDAPEWGHPKGEAATLLAEMANSMLEGRACMVVTASAPGYSDTTAAEALRRGDYQMAAPATSNLGSLSPRYLIFDLPFLFKDIGAALLYTEGHQGQQLLEAGTDQGIKGLGFWADGLKQIATTRAAALPDAVNGMRFGVEGVGIEQDYLRELGTTPVIVAASGLRDAMFNGQIQGMNGSWSEIYTRGFYDSQGAVTETDHGAVQFMVMTSAQFWESLPQDIQDDLSMAILMVSHERNRQVIELSEASKYAILDEGGAVLRLSDEERVLWIRAMQPVWFKYGGDIGFDQISTALSINKEYEGLGH